MSFFVDVVSEDSFYENLTLGVVKILENSPCVRDVRVERRQPCEVSAITNWEQRHCCVLPEDIKNFYTSIDGFLLTWNLDVAGEEFPVGRMEIGTLASLKRYLPPGKEGRPSASVDLTENDKESIASTSVSEDVSSTNISENFHNYKLFELAQGFPSNSEAKVYLAYRSKNEEDKPQIWLHKEDTKKWYELADNFTRYFRMMLVHLGLPMWQCCATELPLPTWVEHVYYLVGPHLQSAMVDPEESLSSTMWNNGPLNVLDPNIFKMKDSKQRGARKKATV